MNLQDYLAEADTIEREGRAALSDAPDAASLEQARIAFLGDRSGRVKALQEALRSIDKADKPAAGKRFNEVRLRLEAAHDERKAVVGRAGQPAAREDLTLPGRRRWRGAKH